MPNPMKNRELTDKEKRFVDEVTRIDEDRPRTSTEAYRRAYEPTGNSTTVYGDASRVFNRPRVQAAIATIESRIEADRRRASRGTLQHMQQKLWSIADDPLASHRDQISAIKGLRDMLPKDLVDDSPNSDSAASKEELVKRLRVVLADVPDAIDVTPDLETGSDADVIDIRAVESPAEPLDDVLSDDDASDESYDEPQY
jgi:hypothetical protein